MRQLLFLCCFCGMLFCGACSNEKNAISHFELIITAQESGNSTPVRYQLTDSVLTITRLDSMGNVTEVIQTSAVADMDSISLIAALDVRARDCREQHALEGYDILFTQNDTTVHVDPNVNHPKELDIAVRIINRVAKPEYHMQFIDMQSAIEPNGRMEI